MSDIFKLILSLSVSGSILALILLAARPLIRKNFSKSWQYYIWLVVILRLLIPYSPETSLVGNLFDRVETIDVEQVSPLPSPEVAGATGGNMVEPSIPYQPIATPGADNGIADYTEYAWLVWMAGAFLLFTVRVFQYRRFTSSIRAELTPVKDKDILALFQQTGDELGIKREITLYQSRLIQSPLLIGGLKAIMVIPEDYTQLHSLKYVFRHEYIHFKRHDILYKWLVQLTVCIHWFNPLVYIMSQQINNLCELSCDEAISRGLDTAGRMEYCNAIMSAVSAGKANRSNTFSMTLGTGKKDLKERLGSIMTGRVKSRKTILSSTILLVALCCAALFLGACYNANDSHGEKPLEELNISHINEIEISAYPSGETRLISNPEDIAAITQAMKKIVTYEKVEQNDNDGQSIICELTMSDGSSREIIVGNSLVGIAGTWYKTQYEPAQALIDLYGQFVTTSESGLPDTDESSIALWGDSIVLIDPGHGGTDPGATFNEENIDLNEKDLNLKLALMLRDMLQESGVQAELTRREDQFLSLEDRMKLAEDINAGLFISIHFNYHPDPTKQGTMIMYNSSRGSSVYPIAGQKAAQLMQDQILKELETTDAGVMAMPDNIKYSNLEMPALMIDPAFLSNASDREIIMDEGFSEKTAQSIRDGIFAILGYGDNS